MLNGPLAWRIRLAARPRLAMGRREPPRAGGAGGRRRRRQACAVLGVGLVTALAAPALGIINPRFTPADLVRGSAEVYLLELRPPAKGEMSAELTETLKGKPPPEKKFVFSYAEARELAEEQLSRCFGGAQTAAGVLLLSAPQPGEDGPAPGALRIGATWFGVAREQGQWRLDRDTRELEAVWAGSARMMAEAARYVEADPTAFFPVRSDLSWGRDAQLGRLAGTARGCFFARLDEPTGDCVVVLADGGDRVYQMPAKDAPPADITAKLKLTTASKFAALGDLDGDGRLDIASWDGQALKLAMQSADGAFAVRETSVKLPGCLSLDVLDAGVHRGAGLLAGTAAGPLLLVPDGKGDFAAAPLLDAAHKTLVVELKEGGWCAVADFDGDGRCDVMQLFTGGSLFFAGEAPGKFQPPVKLPAAGVRNPHGAILGDFDTDGRLDLIVGGDDGLGLVSHAESRRLADNTFSTGELIYHGGQNSPFVTAISACDINSDGRQGAALFYKGQKPMLFFNRGFACFGWARELDVAGQQTATPDVFELQATEAPPKLAAAEAVQNGQLAGAVADLDHDGAQDLICVAPDGQVLVLYGQSENQRPMGLTLLLSSRHPGPLTVTASDQKRLIGMYVLRPGLPAFVGRLTAGPLKLEWRGADGVARSKRQVVTSLARVEIDPLSEH